MKLSRRRGNDEGSGAAEESKGGRHVRSRDHSEGEETVPAAADEVGSAGRTGTRGRRGRGFGPYDAGKAPRGRELLDLGALRIPAAAGVEIQLQTGPEGQIQQLQLAHGGSRLQVGAFAAPRSEGIWDEIREEIRSALVAGGAKPREIEGEYGTELAARVAEGGSAIDVRHLGIDGPRWFVHAVYIGSAAVDPDRAGPLREVLHGVVVDRGSEARPVREALPLRLPPEAAAQLAAAAEERSLDQVT